MESLGKMRKSTVLVTGNAGYIGAVLISRLNASSYNVTGLDSDWFKNKDFLPFRGSYLPKKQSLKDIRKVSPSDLEGIDAIIHLAGLSNDPLGEINQKLTDEINYEASINLALMSKKAGIERFIFSSSCSSYGISSGDTPIDENGVLNPITAYARAKVRVEKKLLELADDKFHPTLMRNATVYGVSPRLRLDLVVNNLTAWGYLTGEVTIMSDGMPWRPIIHVEDISRAFVAVLNAPIEKIHSQVFNIGFNGENYRVKDIAESVCKILPKARVRILNKTGPDERTYRVDFTKFKNAFPEFRPHWGLVKGIRSLVDSYKKYNLTAEDFESDKYFRIRTIKALLKSKKMDESLTLIGG